MRRAGDRTIRAAHPSADRSALARRTADPARPSRLPRATSTRSAAASSFAGGKGGRSREVSMDPWAWEHVNRWIHVRLEMPAGALLRVIGGPTVGRPWSPTAARAKLRHVAVAGWGPSALRAAPAPACARGRDGPRGRSPSRHPASAGPRQSRDHERLPGRHRQQRDHQHRPPAARAGPPGQRRAALAEEALCSPGPRSSAQRRASAAGSHAHGERERRGIGCRGALDDRYRASPAQRFGVFVDTSAPRSRLRVIAGGY